MGETVACGHVFDRWRVRVGGELVFAETTRLDGEIDKRLSETAVAANGAAIASVLKLPGDEADAASIRAMQQNFLGEVGVSAWNGLALARLVAPDGAALRHDLIAVLTAWGGGMLPRLWLN
jgi:urease accessory protein